MGQQKSRDPFSCPTCFSCSCFTYSCSLILYILANVILSQDVNFLLSSWGMIFKLEPGFKEVFFDRHLLKMLANIDTLTFVKVLNK
jgi:hypothetical protein